MAKPKSKLGPQSPAPEAKRNAAALADVLSTMGLDTFDRVRKAINELCDEWPDVRGIQVDQAFRIVRRGDRYAEFGKKEMAWKLFAILWSAKAVGLDRDTLYKLLWPGKPVVPNNLDKQKAICDDVIRCVSLEIAADNRGIWRLASF